MERLELFHLHAAGAALPGSHGERDIPEGAALCPVSGSVDRVTLERAIENLPPGYRLVFVLHDVEGDEHNEIAGMLECSIGNSKSQLHKARMKLRDLLKSGQRKEAVL